MNKSHGHSRKLAEQVAICRVSPPLVAGSKSGTHQLAGGSFDTQLAQSRLSGMRYPFHGHNSKGHKKGNASPFAWPFLALIYMYRYSIGHWFAGSCRFSPSCSHYGEDALVKHGAWRGSIMTIKRLSHCHPWNPGGYDPVE